MTLPRVVYLSAPPYGGEMLAFLRTLPCEVVAWSTTDIELWGTFTDYDLGLNFLGTRKIPENQITKHHWVNFHPAPLPEYRGRNLCYHAIKNGEKEFGSSVHYMDEGFDTGPIIEVNRFPIRKSDTAGDIHQTAIETCKILFRKWVQELLKGQVPSTPQRKEDGLYYNKQAIVESVDLYWDQERLIRALTVHPKHYAKVIVGGKRYKIVPEDC